MGETAQIISTLIGWALGSIIGAYIGIKLADWWFGS
jgi:hypothetical protein